MIRGLKLNFKILLILTILMLISLSTLFSLGKVENFYKNLFFWVIAFLIIFSPAIIRYDYLFRFPYLQFFYTLSIILLIILFIIPSKNRSWIQIGDFSLQPSEFTRIFFLIILAIFLSKYYHLMKNNFFIFLSFLVVSPFMILILLQPDLGMFILYFLTWLAAISLYLPFKKLIQITLLLILIVAISWIFLLKDYQKERILTFINPYKDPLRSGYNIIQLKITLGSAGFWGKGYNQGTQGRLGFLPSATTDFILASFIEERGFIGLFLYCFLMTIFLSIIYFENQFITNPLYYTFSNLLLIHFAIKFLLTTGVNLAILPIIGLPVPFLSYGGSHLISDAILLAIWHSLRYY